MSALKTLYIHKTIGSFLVICVSSSISARASQNAHVVGGEEFHSACIRPDIPVAVLVLDLANLRVLRKGELVGYAVFGEIVVESQTL